MTQFGLLHLFESAEGKTEKEFIDENVEMALHAEAVGLDAMWLAEHHFTDYGVMPSTQVMAGYLAAATKRIRIGSGVIVLPFHNPIRVAEEFALLDLLSDGRIDFGVGRGYQPLEFESYGVPFSESRERFEECLQVIQQAWREGEVNFEGKYYTFKGVKPRPRPIQKPHPPIFGASFNPETIKFQAHAKLNLLFNFLATPPDKIAEYRQILRDSGDDPDDYRIGGLAFVYVDEDRERAMRDFEAPCMWYFKKIASLLSPSPTGDHDAYYSTLRAGLEQSTTMYDAGKTDFEWIVEKSPFSQAFIIGTPDEVRGKLESLLDRYEGVTDVLCWTRLGGLDHRKVMRSMELFAQKVVKPMREDAAKAGA
jgi:natural product biosynthesis luciferase-like monooxygenase protein